MTLGFEVLSSQGLGSATQKPQLLLLWSWLFGNGGATLGLSSVLEPFPFRNFSKLWLHHVLPQARRPGRRLGQGPGWGGRGKGSALLCERRSEGVVQGEGRLRPQGNRSQLQGSSWLPTLGFEQQPLSFGPPCLSHPP